MTGNVIDHADTGRLDVYFFHKPSTYLQGGNATFGPVVIIT